MTTRGRRTELAIDTLILDGVRPADADLVGAALERELARLVRERGVPDGAADSPVPAKVDLSMGEPPEALGARLADAVYRRLAP
jgi:hypothetical protein